MALPLELLAVMLGACRRAMGCSRSVSREVPSRRMATLTLPLMLMSAAQAQSDAPPVNVDNWGYFQRNENGSGQWKYTPKLYVPFVIGGGWTFTQRLDVPMVYTDDKGVANSGGWSAGFGNMLIEEIFESAEVADGLKLRGSVRFVFPTGKAAPFGSSQYQWAPGAGLNYRLAARASGVLLEPFIRYFSGFAPTHNDVTEKRLFEIYPAATVRLDERWSLLLYPENPIEYNRQNGAWFVPLDLMVSVQLSPRLRWGFGGAWTLGDPRDPPYRYIIDSVLKVSF